MKIYAPDYYKDFRCIADKCRHSCCIGWEIDIDEDTYVYYASIDGDFGKRLKDNIHSVDGIPCFKLGENEHCPFLNKDNLCDIILTLGSESLCQICDDHPRYRNYYSSRTEVGLGLCCEEAARLILTRDKKAVIIQIDENDEIAIDDEQEQMFFRMRDKMIDALQDRTLPIEQRIRRLLDITDTDMPHISTAGLADIYLQLERLDDSWTSMLHKLKFSDISTTDSLMMPDTIAEQLLVYMIYRHTADGLYDSTVADRVQFVILSCYMIFAVASACNKGDMQTLLDVARMYSAEIEYSDENIEKLLTVLKNAS